MTDTGTLCRYTEIEGVCLFYQTLNVPCPYWKDFICTYKQGDVE